MIRPKAYISGPITGFPNGNEESFRKAAETLSVLGYKPVVPHDIDPYQHRGSCPQTPDYTAGQQQESGQYHTSGLCYLRSDLIEMLRCDIVVMIDGHESSRGARVERETAQSVGIPVFGDISQVPQA